MGPQGKKGGGVRQGLDRGSKEKLGGQKGEALKKGTDKSGAIKDR